MANVVLISDVRANDPRHDELYLPLASLAIGTSLEAAGHEVLILDGQVEPNWKTKLTGALTNASVLGVSSLTGPSIKIVLDAVAVAREVAPSVPIIWGGYHATQAFRAILEEGVADYVVRGSGEVAIVALLDALQSKGDSDLQNIPNVAFLDHGTVRSNPIVALVDMNALPPVNYDLIRVEDYFRDPVRSVDYISSYGCPYACGFCAEPAQSLRRWRPLAPRRIVSELLALQSRYLPTSVNFCDPNFSTDPRRVMEIVRELERRGASVGMKADMRARDIVMLSRLMDLGRLKNVGMSSIFIGAESGSDRILKRINKGAQVEHTLLACRLLDSVAIESQVSFMHDLPGETVEDSAQTIALAEDLAGLPTNRQAHHFFMPYPLTPIYDELVADNGIAIRNRSQSEWARTSTYWASGVWRGRPAFRWRVVKELHKIAKKHPGALSPKNIPIPSFMSPSVIGA